MSFLRNKSYFYTLRFFIRWRIWAFLTFPIILTPIMIFYHFCPESRCGYIMILVTLYWIFDIMPLAVTALLPVALIPMLGLLSSVEVSPSYMKDTNMLLFVGISCAIGVEYSNLHRRIALKIILVLGTKPRWLFLGFLLPTVLLSMFINNTSATAMMVPIADSVLLEMYPFDNPDETEEEREANKPSDVNLVKESTNIRNGILLCICHGANVGGTGTLVGTGPNLAFANTIESEFPNGEVSVNYLLWMAFAVPNLILCVLLMWLVLQILFLGVKATFKPKALHTDPEKRMKTRAIMQEKYDELGPMTTHEVTILVLFIILILLWTFREPGFMPGWVQLLNIKVKVKDSAPAVLILFCMFALPAISDWWWSDTRDRSLDPPPPRCLTWELIHARMTWGVIFIIGGGFAMADACKASGLSIAISDYLGNLKGTSPSILCLLVMLITFALTTVTSNTATGSILLPIMLELARSMKIAPLYLLIPATLCCSFSFVLPISTPPNAIVYERSRLNLRTMAVTGFWLGLVCILVTFFMISLYAPLIFDLSKYPEVK